MRRRERLFGRCRRGNGKRRVRRLPREWLKNNGRAGLKGLIETFHGANGGRSAEVAGTVIAEMFEGFEARGHGEAGEIGLEAPFGAAQGLAGREAGAEDEAPATAFIYFKVRGD